MWLSLAFYEDGSHCFKKCLEWNFYIFVEMRDSMWHAIEFKHSSTITVIMFCINIYIYLIRMSNKKKKKCERALCIYRYRNRRFALNKIEFPIVCFLHMWAVARARARVTLNWPNDCRRTHSFFSWQQQKNWIVTKIIK